MTVGIPNLEKPENTDLILPEIPEGFVRLTHFTSQRIAERLMAGENFTYGFLSSTVDSFSDNVQILELIKTGKTGNFPEKDLVWLLF
jgi:hypothetical protein